MKNKKKHILVGYIFAINLFIINIDYAQLSYEVEPFLPKVFLDFTNVRDISIDRTFEDVYFTAQSHMAELSIIMNIKKIDNQWSAPTIVSFSGKYNDLEPFLSPNGLQLYYASNRPILSTESEVKDYDIWFVERESLSEPWSDPIRMSETINTKANQFYPSITTSGNLYYCGDGEGSKGKDDIFCSQWDGMIYGQPFSIDSTINEVGYEFNAYVSPDERFIIYTAYNRKDGFGSGDLYISFKEPNGDWSPAINLGDQINSSKMDYCPFVDLETNTLHFTSKRSNVSMKEDGFSSWDVLSMELNRYDNGMSRLYKVSIDHLLKNK
jgi:hypothetical protein